MLVERAMTANVVTATSRTTIDEAAEQMARGRFRHLPVVDGSRLVGIISERDVRPPKGIRAELAETLGGRPVSAVMHTGVITVAPDDPLEEAARLLHENMIGALPVVTGDATLAGIITTSDIFNAYMRTLGVDQPSTRFEVEAADMPAALHGIADVAADLGVAITGLATERDPATGASCVVVRFATIQGPRLSAALRARGLRVAGPDVNLGG